SDIRASIEAESRARGTARKQETSAASGVSSLARSKGLGQSGATVSTVQPASVSAATAASVPGKRTFPSFPSTSSVGTVTKRRVGMAREDIRAPAAAPRCRQTPGPGVDCARGRPGPPASSGPADDQGGSMSASAAAIPSVPFFQTAGDRRSIRYFDPDKKVEDWQIQAILQTARFASCQGN